jgi:hypothetical protein
VRLTLSLALVCFESSGKSTCPLAYTCFDALTYAILYLAMHKHNLFYTSLNV